MHTDVNACDCAQGCTDTAEEFALKVDWEKNPLPVWGIEPVSVACQSEAYQLSHIPSQRWVFWGVFLGGLLQPVFVH